MKLRPMNNSKTSTVCASVQLVLLDAFVRELYPLLPLITHTHIHTHSNHPGPPELVDKIKIGLLTTTRPNIGPVSRAMATSKRVGPDFLFLANCHSRKFNDIDANPTVQITFQDSSTQDWISITGKAVTASNSDPRIKELYSKPIKAWFGDLGDGKHDGGPEDPRMSLIEVKSSYIAYWKKEVTKLGFAKEIMQSTITGQVAQTGVMRELDEAAIEKARGMA